MKGKTRKELESIGKATQFRKGDERARSLSRKGLEIRKARSVLRSSEAILEADRNGSLSQVVENVLTSLDSLYKKKDYDKYIKHSLSLLELVNGRQVKLETPGIAHREINIVFRRATPDDAK